MPRYLYDVSISRQKRFIRRFKKVILIFLFIASLGGLIVLIDGYRQKKIINNGVGAPVTTTVGPSIKEFDTSYFTFTAASNWRSVAGETAESKYVYRSYRGQLVEQELKIYLNGTTDDLAATRVLPVRLEENGKIVPSEVSEHCSSASPVKTARTSVSVTIEEANFLCILDSTNFVVVIAEKGGGTSLELNRSAGEKARYSFLYRNSTINLNTKDLTDILNSFRAK